MLKTKRNKLNWTDIDMAEINLDKLVLHFCQCMKAEGKSPATIRWYSEMIRSFVSFLLAVDREPILGEFTLENARDFIIHEQERQVSPYTVQAKVRALKGFSSWLFGEGYQVENVLALLKIPKAPIKLIEPLTTEEIDSLLSVQNPLTAIGSRNLAILITLLGTGIRESELSNLRDDDSHIEEGYIKVMGKGSKERVVPLGAIVQKILWRYIFHFRPEPESEIDNYLFLTMDGKKLRSNAIKLLLSRWGKRAEVPRVHAHLCRHTFATNFLIHNCGDVFRLQQILGHSTLEMVRRYVHYASTESMIQGQVSSPLDRMGIKKLRGYKIDQMLKNFNGNKGMK
jgi:integrase/recombinase XerC/integrase/recombinase XerD